MDDTTFVHVTPSVSRLGGGLFESVRRLSQSVQAASPARVRVLAAADRRSGVDVDCWAPLEVETQRVFGPKNFGYSPGLGGALVRASPSLVHLHGLWRYSSLAVWRWCRARARPYIVSPHGMLEPWALEQSRLKKRCALRFYVGPCLRQAACLRATSVAEAEAIRRAGFKNSIALVPNGVELPTGLGFGPCPGRSVLGVGDERAAGHGRNPRRALFLSRIHPKKGLLNLVEAWGRLRLKGWELWVAGPDEGNHLAAVAGLVRGLGLAEQVRFVGELWGQDKSAALMGSDVFVLPSFSENFGLVIAEALAHGVPVITTTATPWRELVDYNCGWWIELGVEPLAQALREALSTPREVLREMGLRGRKLVAEKYRWEQIGKNMVEVYQWMLSRRDRPDYVLR